MRILVQDSLRKVYFDGADWTADAEHAKSFESVAQAESFCQEHQWPTALVVVKFKDSSRDISFPAGGRHALLVCKPPPTRISSLF
jgi:hypothetical protein